MAGDLEAARVARRVGEQGVDVGSRVLTRDRGIEPSLRPPGSARVERHCGAMKHTAHGYWLEEAGEVDAGAAAGGRARGRRARRRRRLHRALDRLARAGSSSPTRGSSCSRPRSAGTGRAGATAASATRCGSRCRACASAGAPSAALAVARAAEQAVDGIGAFCEEQGVDAWFRRGGYLQVSTAAAHDGVLAEAVEACRELGAPEAVQPLSAEQVAGRCASPLFRAGALSPARRPCSRRGWRSACARGCARRGRGLRVSPVRALREGAGRRGPHRRAAGPRRRAVLAIGGAAKGRRGPLRGRLSVASSHIVLTEPVPELLEEIGWTGGECITDSRALLDYFRTTPDGRIAFGWGGGRIAIGARTGGRAELDPAVVAATAEHLHAFFPGLAGSRITHAWGGPIDASPTHLPMVMPLRHGRAFAAAGYTGNGVGPSHMVGRTLASLALDRRDEPSRPRLRRPLAPAGPAGALPLDRRRSDPARASSPRRRPSWRGRDPAASPQPWRGSPS